MDRGNIYGMQQQPRGDGRQDFLAEIATQLLIAVDAPSTMKLVAIQRPQLTLTSVRI